MLEGLEASIVSKSRMLASASTTRLDPEYYLKKHLHVEELVSKGVGKFVTPAQLEIAVDASAFYPSIKEFYRTGDFPFYRVGDVDGMIDVDKALRVPENLCSRFPTLRKVVPGDILFTKGGAIDRTGYVTHAGAVSRDLIFLNTSKLPQNKRLALLAYFQTDFFKLLLLRSSSQTAQPHLTITLVRDLPIFQGSPSIEAALAETILNSYSHADAKIEQLRIAEEILLSALGLADWQPPEPLTFTASISAVASAGRFDAQYFRPLYEEVEQRLTATGSAVRLGSILDVNSRGKQPDYAPQGLPVVNSKHVRTNRVVLNDNRTGIKSGSPVTIQKGDVLLNGTGVGTIGRAAPYMHLEEALPDNHVTVLRSDGVDPLFLALFLNSKLGQLQIERHIKGSSGQIELYPSDIADLVFWDAPKNVQKAVKDAVQASFEEERRAAVLMDTAKRAVEIAIATGEPAALAFLEQNGKVY